MSRSEMTSKLRRLSWKFRNIKSSKLSKFRLKKSSTPKSVDAYLSATTKKPNYNSKLHKQETKMKRML